MSKNINLRVSQIEPVGGHGGMNYYDFSLATGLVNNGVNVFLYTSDETKEDSTNSIHVKKYFNGIYGNSSKYLRGIKYLKGLFKSLIDSKKNLVKITHFHFFHNSLLELLTITLAKMFGFKVIITAHDVESFSGNSSVTIARAIYNICDKIIAHNEVSKNELINLLNISHEKVEIIPHGHYLGNVNSYLSKEEARKIIKVNGSGPFLLFFGQIKKVKGLEVLLRSLPDVVRDFPELKLIIAGKVWKNDFSIYEELIRNLNIGNSIEKHIKYIPDENVDAYFQAADLIVLPYKKIYQSGVLLLSMSYKRPVLVSNLLGMTEIVKEGFNGYLFENENSKNLSLKLLKILYNKAEMDKVADNGYQTILKKHDWNQIGAKTKILYKTLL